MPSSLATQLAKGASLNAPLLAESQRKKHFASSSYLFSASTKAQIDDLDSIHALAESALAQLRLAYPDNTYFATDSSVYQTLFSHRARETDRTLMTTDALAEVNAAIRICLRALGRCLLEDQAGRVIEWLVRRFRINEFNVDDVLFVFLPYHESTHFAKMVSILSIDASTPWAFLAGYKASGRPLQRSVLVSEMLRTLQLARSVLSILPECLTSDGNIFVHETLLYFSTATMMEYLLSSDKSQLDAAMLAFLVPSLIRPLELGSEVALAKDLLLGSFILLSTLSQKISLTQEATKAIATKMILAAAAASQQIDVYQLLTALVSFLGPQTAIEKFSPKAGKAIASMPNCENALARSLGWKGADKLLSPLLPGLLDQSQLELVEYLITAQDVPRSILQVIAEVLLGRDDDDSLQLLSTMHQRHLEAIQAAIDALASSDENLRNKLEARVINLTSPVFAGNNIKGIIIASNNVDAAVRKSAVRSLSQLVEDASPSISDDERASLRVALLARVFDGNASVLETLYADPKPVAKLVDEKSHTIEKLSNSLVEQGLSKSLLRAHLEFFCTAFLELYPEHTPRVLLSLIIPFMLHTKPRAKTAAVVWEVVQSSRLGTTGIMAEVQKARKAGGEEMRNVNEAVANRLAENLKGAPELPLYIDGLVEHATRNDPHARLSAWLILRHLFLSLSVEMRLSVIRRIFGGKALEWIIESSDSIDLTFDEETLQRAIFSKPSSIATLAKLQISFLSLLRASNGTYKNHCFSSKRDDVADLLKVYYAISSSVLPTRVVSSLCSTLFETLGCDSLLFLADVWTAPPSVGSIDADTVAYIALRHALSFIRAREAAALPEDLQVVIPALLQPLQSTSKKVREAAVQCISAMVAIGKKGRPKSIYGYDKIYGSASEKLQYLDWDDELKLLQGIVEHEDHLTNSHGSLAMFFVELLAPAKASGKKEVKQRRRILSFLLSHVMCCPRTSMQSAVLQSIHRVSDASKVQMLTPMLQDTISNGTIESEKIPMAMHLVGSVDKSAAKELNEENGPIWTSLLASLDTPNSPLRKVKPIWARFSSNLVQGGLFNALKLTRQLELILKLVDIGVRGDDELGVKALLRNCLQDSRLVIRTMQSLLSDINETSERRTKKARVDVSPSTEASNMVRLAFFLEILVSQNLPASLELLSELLEALNRVMSSTAGTLDSDGIYVVQLLMASLDSCGSQIKELPNVAPSNVRFDVLVELMRTSENLQTFQQALMVMANLARLSPASILTHVMPIFTFMGSNVFHRDDTYSFKVIQKTIEEIVPVAATSLRDKYSDRRTLMLKSRSLLRMFTDAQNHVPRHRRTNFFTRLVDVLGPAEYLAPVAMLLVEKSANRVARQDIAEAQSSLGLPLAVMQHYDGDVRLSAVQEVLLEVEKMTSTNTDGTVELFLELPMSDESHISPAVLRTRQMHTLLIFIGHAIKQIPPSSGKDDSDHLKEIVSLLLAQSGKAAENDHPDKRPSPSSPARWALKQTMNVLSVSFFVSTVLSMLRREDNNMIRGALELLLVRVPIIGSQARKSVSPEMSSIIRRITDIAAKSHDRALVTDAMKALSVITRSAQQEEEASLSSALPVVIDVVKRQPDSVETLALIPVLISKLGPRVIAQLSHVVEACISAANFTRTDIVKLAHDSLHGLMKSVPSFWSTRDVTMVINYCVSHEATDALVKFMAKQLPSTVLLSAAVQSWPSVDSLNGAQSSIRMSRFFDLLRRCLHHIALSDISANLKTLYDRFIVTLDLRGACNTEEASKLEDKIIAAYMELIIKLNETTFQPLFRRMCDWAFGNGRTSSRLITFCRIYSELLDLFKELMAPYMSIVYAHFVELITVFANGNQQESELWRAALQTLGKSFAIDDGVFWHDSRIRPLVAPIVDQLATPLLSSTVSSSSTTSAEMKFFVEALSGLIGCAEDDALIKDMNLKILMHTRSEDVRVRLAAVQSSIAVWETQGHKLRGFASETAAFILECAEDENGEIVRASGKLRDAVEKVSGKIDGL